LVPSARFQPVGRAIGIEELFIAEYGSGGFDIQLVVSPKHEISVRLKRVKSLVDIAPVSRQRVGSIHNCIYSSMWIYSSP
jgi:hypothetical protein